MPEKYIPVMVEHAVDRSLLRAVVSLWRYVELGCLYESRTRL